MATVARPLVEQTTPRELVGWTLSGRIRFPPFQRSYRSERDFVLKVFDSLLHGYPIGNLIVLRRPADADTLRVGPLTITADARPDAFWVVDGQQRLTSLVGALAAPAETSDPRFRIFFDPRENVFVSGDRHRPVPEHWFPLPKALSTAETLAWQRERPWLTDAELARCHAMTTAIRDHPIAMYVIEGDGDTTQYSLVFQRINSSGVSLRRDELDNARRAASEEGGTSDLSMPASAAKRAGFGTIPDDLLTQMVLGARRDEARPADLGGDETRPDSLHVATRALGTVIDFLRDEAGIPHIRLLPRPSFLPVLVRFAARFGPPEGRAAELLRRWIWRGAVLDPAPRSAAAAMRRYGQAVEDDPLASADRLLGLLPPDNGWEPDLTAIRRDQARTKINILGMSSRRPRILAAPEDPDDAVGTIADLSGLVEQRGNPLLPIVTERGGIFDTVANRLVHPRNISVEDLHRALFHGSSDPEILESHFIDDEGLGLWQRRDRQGFVAHRAELVRVAIAEHVQDNALFGFPDGPDPTVLTTIGNIG
ncbi:GmrSD restriction endonuclease domain-containing protein [Streptosporangium sp. DT93]|uniref:GmrSD restriction endonuclease domain-containing protein n=1 Tax=Streptosporangium sp. DT93 TaxID=3393428 RepID=UPI003CEDCF8A